MADQKLFDPEDDQWLSAYVDQQLTPAQRQAVDERLEHDPDARRLVTELRHLASMVRALPQEDVSEDLRDRVFQQAEREMLLGTTQPIPQPSCSRNASPATLALGSLGHCCRTSAYLPAAIQRASAAPSGPD